MIDNNLVTETSDQLNNESLEEIQPLGNELGKGKRTQKMTQRMQESLAQLAENIVSYKVEEDVEEEQDYYL